MGSFDCTNDGVCVVRRKCRNNQNFFPTTASRKLKYMRLLCFLSRVSRLKKLFFGEGKRGKLLDIQHNPKMINCFRLIFIPSTSLLLCICFVQWELFSTPVWLFMERFVLFLWLLPVESFQSFICWERARKSQANSSWTFFATHWLLSMRQRQRNCEKVITSHCTSLVFYNKIHKTQFQPFQHVTAGVISHVYNACKIW